MSSEASGASFGLENDEDLQLSSDQSMYTRLRNIAAGAIVSYEANPVLNDGSRLGATAAIFASTHDPRLTSLAFAGMTFGVEAAGAWGASHVLETKTGKRFIEKTHNILEKARISRYVSGALPDAAVSMTLGTSVMLAAKQAKDPSRTQPENIRYGTAMALGVTAVASAEVFGLSTSISEGLNHPNPVMLGVGAVCLAAMVKGGDILRRTLKADTKVAEGTRLYREKFDARAKGPQVEGLSVEEVRGASLDKRSLFVEGGKANNAKFPVLVPIEYNAEYNKRYFDTHFTDTDVYHFTDVFEKLGSDAIDEDVTARAVAKTLKKLSRKGALVVTDLMADGQNQSNLERILDLNSIKYDRTLFVDPRNNSPASVTHFSGDGEMQPAFKSETRKPAQSYSEAFKRLRRRSPEKYDDTYGTVLIEPDEISDELFEDIWSLYAAQFDELIKENPSMQAQTKDDLRNTLTSEGSLLVASFEEGKPVCVAYFVTDISKVYWLQQEYYERAFPDKTVWYFPGIAVHPNYEGLARSMSVIGLATEIANECDLEPTITFQCTNVSKDYVPKIAQFSIEHTGEYKISFQPIAEYKYVGYKLR
jgi:hypothetical protein